MPAQPSPHLLARLWLAIVCWFRIVFDVQFAGQVAALRDGGQAALPAGAAAPLPRAPAPVAPSEAGPKAPAPRPVSAPPSAAASVASAGPGWSAGALHLLSLLQREARLIDFCQEELASFSDAEVGAAARAVHAGCRKVVRDHLSLAPLRTEPEGAPVVLERGFDPSTVRLSGSVTGEPPFRGTLRHHGWRATQVRLPEPPRNQDERVLAPAEVELP